MGAQIFAADHADIADRGQTTTEGNSEGFREQGEGSEDSF
jgi:hypothetical protein